MIEIHPGPEQDEVLEIAKRWVTTEAIWPMSEPARHPEPPETAANEDAFLACSNLVSVGGALHALWFWEVKTYVEYDVGHEEVL